MSEIRVIETSSDRWEYKWNYRYLLATWEDGELVVEVGFDGISEEPQHSIELPLAVYESLRDWVSRSSRSKSSGPSGGGE